MPFGIRSGIRMICAISKFGLNMWVLKSLSHTLFCLINVTSLLACFYFLSGELLLLQADNCFDKEVIYAFLDANGIGKSHSDFYISYALHLESKSKFKAANQIFELGISRY